VVWSIPRVRFVIGYLAVIGACSSAPALDAREQRIVTALADDNYLWAIRDPALTALKLRKLQRGPYEWLRGTASLYWRDVMEPGVDRPASAFGDEASSRVLLIGDPHPENVGTYRASDGTMFIDWNDFDSTGYGPFTGDLRRLGAGLAIAAPDVAALIVERAVAAYAETMLALAAGERVGPVLAGRAPLFDDELDTAETRGDRLFAVDELAPVMNGVRTLAQGDLEDVAADGLIEDRVIGVSPEVADWLDRAVAAWGHSELGAIKLRARRIGSGVSSYAAYRWNVVLEGATPATDDDRVIELKETREGLVVRNVPRLPTAEWSSPGARAVDTQQRLHARADGDPLLGSALVGGLSVKIRDREAYQRGVDREDLTELAEGSDADRAELAELAAIYGELLARAHGLARTEDGLLGHEVIAPLLAGRESELAADLGSIVQADAARIVADHMLMKDVDLMALVAPEQAP
jgi:uncharacterized protein (DUF2252 family)